MTETSQSDPLEQGIPPVLEDHTKIDDMLNTPGFVEFLAKHPDETTPEDSSLIEKHFEVFETMSEVKEKLKSLYNEKIGKEMGIVLEGSDLASIDADIDTKAVNDPDAVLELSAKLKSFDEMPAQTKALEDELGKLGSAEDWSKKLSELQERKNNIDTIKDNVYSIKGIASILFDFDMARDTWKAFWANRKEGLGLHIGDLHTAHVEVGDKIAEIQKVLETIQNVEQLKGAATESFTKLRKEILGDIGDSAELTQIIQKKIKGQMTALLNSDDFDTAQARFEELKKISSDSETRVDIFGSIDTVEFQKIFDVGIEQSVNSSILKKITELKLGDGNLSKLEKSLEFFLKRDKLGSKQGYAVRRFVGKSLSEAVSKLSTSVEDKAKKILINRIKIKYNLL